MISAKENIKLTLQGFNNNEILKKEELTFHFQDKKKKEDQYLEDF